MKAQKTAKWMALAALLMFVAAVFQIASDHFWIGMVFIGAGACLSAAAASYRNKEKAETEDCDPQDHE